MPDPFASASSPPLAPGSVPGSPPAAAVPRTAERRSPVAAIEALCAHVVDGRGSGVLLEASDTLTRRRLARTTVAHAGHRGVHVLAADPEPEAEPEAWAGALALLRPTLTDDDLATLVRDAAVFDGLAVVRRLHASVRAIAADGPAVLVLRDAHLMDGATLGFVLGVLEMIDDDVPVSVVVTAAPGWSGPAASLLRCIAADAFVRRVSLP